MIIVISFSEEVSNIWVTLQRGGEEQIWKKKTSPGGKYYIL